MGKVISGIGRSIAVFDCARDMLHRFSEKRTIAQVKTDLSERQDTHHLPLLYTHLQIYSISGCRGSLHMLGFQITSPSRRRRIHHPTRRHIRRVRLLRGVLPSLDFLLVLSHSATAAAAASEAVAHHVAGFAAHVVALPDSGVLDSGEDAVDTAEDREGGAGAVDHGVAEHVGGVFLRGALV